MRVTKRTDIAMRMLMYCAANPDRLVTKSEIAGACNVSENHLAQVINQLSQIGYLSTHRGRNGGLWLSRPADTIFVGDIFRKVEAGLPLAECFGEADKDCPLIDSCRLRLALIDASEAFYAHLDGITLDSLLCDNHALGGLLHQDQRSQQPA